MGVTEIPPQPRRPRLPQRPRLHNVPGTVPRQLVINAGCSVSFGRSPTDLPGHIFEANLSAPQNCINLSGKYAYQGKELNDFPNYFRAGRVTTDLPSILRADPLPKEARAAVGVELIHNKTLEMVLRGETGLLLKIQIFPLTSYSHPMAEISAPDISCDKEHIVVRFTGRVIGEDTREQFMATQTLHLDQEGALIVINDREVREQVLFFSVPKFHEHYGTRFLPLRATP